MIVCSCCGRAFDPDRSPQACAGCALLMKNCGKVRCPRCGYENQRPLRDAFKGLRDRLRRMRHVARH